METTTKGPKLFEHIADSMLRFLNRYRIPLLSALIFGMLAHGFAFTNKYINHDELYNLFGKGATIDSGRWGLGIMDSFFPNYSMPWIYGIFTIFLVALSVCLILHIFSVRSRILQILLAGCVVVFPVLTSTFSFMFTSSSYGTAFLLAVLSVYFLRRPHIFSWVLALGCGIFSVAIYQAYIAVIAGLLVLTLIQDLLLEEAVLPMVRRGFFYVGFLILTLGLYYIATQLVLILKDVHFNEYAAERNSFTLSSLFSRILSAYTHFFQVLETGEHALIPTLFSRRLHWLCLGLCSILFLLLCASKPSPSRILFLLAMTGVFPLAISCMYLFTPEDAVHTLVLCGYVCIYVFFVVVADRCISLSISHNLSELLRRAALNAMVFALSAVILSNTYFANEAYLQLHLQYENTYAFYTSLLSDLKQNPEFNAETKLAVIGPWSYPDYFFQKFEFTYHLFGHLNSSPNEYSMDRFLEYYIGLNIPFASDAEKAAIQASPEFAQMPVYPYYGSIQTFGDILVVKLS